MSNLIAKEYQGFEQIKHTDDEGNEFWYARELAAGVRQNYLFIQQS
jgi:DNA-damage-inducible protein D